MSADRLSFAVLGTGNSGQTFAADITLKGFPVNLAEVPEYVSTLDAIRRKGGIEISGVTGEGFAELNMITTDLKEAVKGVKVIIIGGSAFAHEPFSKALLNHFEDGQYILFTSNFGAMRFKKWLIEAGITTDVTPVETISLPYATRAAEPGVVNCLGVKSDLPVAALPAGRTAEFLELVKPVFPQFSAVDNVLAGGLSNLNPIVHPPMVLFNAGRIEALGGKGWNLYADGATPAVAEVMLGLDRERLSLLEAIGSKGSTFKDTLERLYAVYNIARPTLSETLRQSPVHGDPSVSAPDEVNTRYIAEDLPFGLAAWSALGREWGCPTPTIDACVHIAGLMIGRDYFKEGLTAENLGVAGFTPEQVVQQVA